MNYIPYNNSSSLFKRLKNKTDPRLIAAVSFCGLTIIVLLSFAAIVHNISDSMVNTQSFNPNKVFGAIMRSSWSPQSELANLYSQYLTPSDYVFTITTSDPLVNIEDAKKLSGMTGVVYYSLQRIQDNIEEIKQRGGIEFIGYDLEDAHSPSSDVQNALDSVRRASDIAHRNGFDFMLLPGWPIYTGNYPAQFAPYVDSYVIQAQGKCTSASDYEAFVKPIVSSLKSANPNIKVITELGAHRNSVLEMQNCFSRVSQIVDGVTVWFSYEEGQLQKVNEFLSWFNKNHETIAAIDQSELELIQLPGWILQE